MPIDSTRGFASVPSGGGQGVRRLTINLPESVYGELVELASRSGRTMTDIVRSSLALVKIAVEEEAADNKLAIVKKDGTLLKELVLPR